MTIALKSFLVAGFTAVLLTAATAQEVDWAKVDAALGRKGAVTDDVHRYSFPRTDLSVTVDRNRDQAGIGARGLGRI